jgi:uncharacterized delta-60 repeat protein
VLYEVFDSYAPFVDGSTYLETWKCGQALQSDGKVLIAARAADEPTFGGCADHFIGRMNADGTVDTSFGNNGYHRLDILNDGDLTFDYPSSVIILPDDKILVAGTTGGSTTDYSTLAWYLVKYDSSGALDTDFGNNGIVVDSVPNVMVAKYFNADVRPSGKIVVAGAAEWGERLQCTVAQYNPDGTPDIGFGEGGIASYIPPGVGWQDGGHVLILRNGKIAVAGFSCMYDDHILSSVIMFNDDGTVDESFGNGGVAHVETWPETGPDRIGWEWFGDIVEQDDGKLLAYGTRAGILESGEFEYAYSRTMARFNADGSLDQSFGTNGMVIPNKIPNYRVEQCCSLALQDDQKIVTLGFVSEDTSGFNMDMIVERYNVDGTRDLSFDGTGRIYFRTPGNELAQGLHILQDNTIVIGGTHTSWEPGGLSKGLLLYLFPMP